MRKITATFLLLLSGIADADQSPPAQLLFDSNDILTMEIQLPFKQLDADRKGKPIFFPAQLSYQDSHNQTVTLDIDLRTRGNARRKSLTCDFPPMKIRLQGDTEATLFEHQKTLKLVTHCNNKNINDQYVLKEYIAYRVYNLLTEYAFRARLAHITYREGEKLIAKRYAIILERWKNVAARTNTEHVKTTEPIDLATLSAYETSLMGLFQYMVGNDDWSALWPAEDAECCHNVKLLLTDEGTMVPLPYDYDSSGLVETNYAVSRLGTRNVRKRRYLGYCQPPTEFEAAMAHMKGHRESIDDLVSGLDGLSSRAYKRTLKYFARFYEVLDDSKKLEKRVIERCRTK